MEVTKYLHLSYLSGRVDHYKSKITTEHFLALGTVGTLYILYKNYRAITQIKERRKTKSGNSFLPEDHNDDDDEEDYDEDEEFCVCKRKEPGARNNQDRNIFQKIWNLWGVFDSLEGLDRILSVIWFPSVERGIGFIRFGEKNETFTKPNLVWHYGDVQDLSVTVFNAPTRSSHGLPINIFYLLKISRVFGHWFLDDILRLNEFVTYETVPAESFLFKIDDPDDKVYIVLEGTIELCFQDEEGERRVLKTLRSGDQIISVLSVIDFIVEKNGVYKSVQAQALSESLVMKIPMSALVFQLMTDPKSLSRGVQRVLRRAYEVIFLACFQTLGLSLELIREVPRKPLNPGKLEQIPALEKPPEWLVEEAGSALLKVLQLPEKSLLSECTILVIPPDFLLYEAGKFDNNSVTFVHEGELEVCLKFINSGSRDEIFYVNAGEIFGALAFLTDDSRLFTVKTSVKSVIGVMPAKLLKDLLDIYPVMFYPLVESILNRLSPFARQMDYGLEWTYVDSGQALFYTDDEPNATYLVLSGRLKSFIPRPEDQQRSSEVIVTSSTSRSMVGEYGKYDFVGLPEMWTRHRRTKTVVAVRDTEVTKIPYDFFTYICGRHAKIAVQIVQFLTKRILNSYKSVASVPTTGFFDMEDFKGERIGSRSTYALFPASPDVPVAYIATEFERLYSRFGSILVIDSAFVKGHFGADVFSPGAHSGLTSWLGFLESKYSKILYVGDSSTSRWSVKCFHQADMIFIGVNSEGRKEISAVENMILNGRSLAKVELLICHRYQDGFPKRMPMYTKRWLEPRPWLHFHHHLFINSKFFGLRNEEVKRMDEGDFGRNEDIARVVRWLTGRTFGLALGGGGAKGAAHIGFLREFRRTGLPIDMICGVSIGSFIGALFAVYEDPDSVEKLAKNWFAETANPLKFFLDFTVPYVSIFRGDSLNFSLIELFGDLQIEDMRIPFFTCTTDLSNNSIREHRCGSLWRYVRASMTLVNLFPPVCDPRDGHYLIDGGYTNLVPADMMRKLGVRYILAVDISSKANHYRNTFYGDAVSGLNLLSHMAPVLSRISVPSILEIQDRLTWAQSMVYLNLVKRMEVMETEGHPSIVYIRLPIDFYSTSDFKRFENIKDIGSNFGKRVLENVQPGDDVDLIWLKLKYNRGIHRFGSFLDNNNKNSSLMDNRSTVTVVSERCNSSEPCSSLYSNPEDPQQRPYFHNTLSSLNLLTVGVTIGRRSLKPTDKCPAL